MQKVKVLLRSGRIINTKMIPSMAAELKRQIAVRSDEHWDLGVVEVTTSQVQRVILVDQEGEA